MGRSVPAKRFIARHRIAAAAVLLLSIGSAAAANSESIALTHIRLIDGLGSDAVEDATILVDGGRILAAGANVAIPAEVNCWIGAE